MTAAVRLHIHRQIDQLARERVASERVLFCNECFELYDKGTRCACRRMTARAARRKAASPVVA